jgi:hypothetical protein
MINRTAPTKPIEIPAIKPTASPHNTATNNLGSSRRVEPGPAKADHTIQEIVDLLAAA